MPFYRYHLKAASLAGTFVINDPVWWSADEKFFGYSLAHYYGNSAIDPHTQGGTNLWRRFMDVPPEQRTRAMEQRARYRGQLGGAALTGTEEEPKDENARALWRAARRGGAIGTSDTLRENLRQYESSNVDVMVLIAQCGDRTHEHIMESIERFAKDVMPDFKERHETQHKKWREQQLDGVQFPINSSI